MGDFRAFYCGGTAVLHGSDPYAAVPLLGCERSPQPFGLHTVHAGVDLPAPFPGYALSLFTVMALLPYPPAAALWLVVLLTAAAAACVFLARLCGRSAVAPFVLLAPGFSIAVIPYGELAPITVAALAGGALALRHKRLWGAIGALAVAALLPHIALPVFLSLFIWLKTARTRIVLLGIGLLALDLAIGGPRLALSYFTRVLPNHAVSEIGYITQYSMTWIAQGLGAPDRLALLMGDLSYVVMVVFGVWLAGMLMQRFEDPAFLLLIPPACAVFGGPFVHYSEITLALPASLLLYSHCSGRARTCAAVSLVCIALPWEWIMTQPTLAVPIVAATVAIVAATLDATLRVSLRAGLGAALFCAICMSLAAYYGPQTAPHVGSMTMDPSLAEASWAKFVGAHASSSGFVWWFAKLPTWFGLLALLSSGVFAVSENRPPVLPVRDSFRQARFAERRGEA